MVEHLAQGATLDDGEEIDALDYLLGTPAPIEYEVTVDLDTDRGRAPLTFVFGTIDGRKLDAIEGRHRNQTTGVLDVIGSDLEVVAVATKYLLSARGKQIEMKSDAFLTVAMRQPDGAMERVKVADPAIALERRFAGQQGLLQGVAREVRKASGWDAERQGQAKRRLARAALD